MASKRHLRRRSCEGKIRHPSLEAAVRHRNYLRGKDGSRQYHAYRCPFCRDWHVGRRPVEEHTHV